MKTVSILAAGLVACVAAPTLAVLRLPAPDGSLFALAILAPAALLAVWSSGALLDGRFEGLDSLGRCLRERRPRLPYWALRGLATALVATGLTLIADVALSVLC